MTDSATMGEEPVAPEDAGTAEQPELDLGVVPTGDPRVDGALGALDVLADLPVDEHPSVFEAVHQGLHEALSDVSEPSG